MVLTQPQPTQQRRHRCDTCQASIHALVPDGIFQRAREQWPYREPQAEQGMVDHVQLGVRTVLPEARRIPPVEFLHHVPRLDDARGPEKGKSQSAHGQVEHVQWKPLVR